MCLICNFSYVGSRLFMLEKYIFHSFYIVITENNITKPNFPKFIDTGCSPHELTFMISIISHYFKGQDCKLRQESLPSQFFKNSTVPGLSVGFHFTAPASLSL